MRVRQALIALLLPALANAYTVSAPDADPPIIPVKWPSMTVTPVEVDIHDAGTTSPNAADAVSAIENAFATWEAVTEASVQFNVGSWSGSHMGYGEDTGNGINRVGFVLADWPPTASSALAVTVVQGGGGGTYIAEADIYFNEHLHDWSTAPGGEPDLFDVEAVATHEIGHFIGLDHTPIVIATMYYATGPNTIIQRTLHADDEEGARFLYPASGTHVCDADGECPTLQKAFDRNNTVLGKMVCDVGTSTCCLGGACTGSGGALGDPCQGDSDCNPGLQCPYDGDTCRNCDPGDDDDGLYVPCQFGSDCPAGDACYDLQNEGWGCGHCLPPCEFQSDCFPTGHCLEVQTGDFRCAPDDYTGYYRCRRDEPSQCPTGQGCRGTTIGEICWDRGATETGDSCAVDTDCYTLLCDRTGTCVQACGDAWPPCPDGQSCLRGDSFPFTTCEDWGPEPLPEPVPEPVPEPAPEPVPEPGPDMGADSGVAAPDAGAFIPAEDEGCSCAVGRRFDVSLAHALLWLAGLVALRSRPRRR